jgi:hypothetical protein
MIHCGIDKSLRNFLRKGMAEKGEGYFVEDDE